MIVLLDCSWGIRAAKTVTPLALEIAASWLSRPTVRRELVEEFACEIEASQALEAVAQAKRQLSGPIKVIGTGA